MASALRMSVYALLLYLCLVILTALINESPVAKTSAPSQSQPQSCTDRHCIDIPAGLRIASSHIDHITAIWDLVEGLGHPGQTFHPTAERLGLMTCQTCPQTWHDPESSRFLNHMHEFLWIAKRLDSKLTNTLLPSAVWSFGIILKILLHVQETFTEIELLQARYRDVLDVEIDRILNATIGRIVTEMNGTVCEMILDNSEIAIPLAWNTSSLGSELAGGLDGELARVQDALNRLPWWDTWDLYHLTGISRIGVLHRAYLKFFEEEGRILRSLADSSTLIHENLVDINNYCVWYTTDDYVQLMHTNAAKIGDVTAAAIARDIETLKNRIELAVEVGKTPQVPGWPPQRRAARTLFRTY